MIRAKDATICEILRMLYSIAALSHNEHQIELTKQAFIKAKKMNRKLYRYKYKGKLPDISNNSWLEEDWLAELNDIKGGLIDII